MTEKKRFCKGYYSPEWYTVCEIEKDEEVICTVALKDADFIIEIFEENEKLEKENEQLKKELDLYSHNAHLFIGCYEKAINKIENEYNDNSVVLEAFDKLNEYYIEYARNVGLE